MPDMPMPQPTPLDPNRPTVGGMNFGFVSVEAPMSRPVTVRTPAGRPVPRPSSVVPNEAPTLDPIPRLQNCVCVNADTVAAEEWMYKHVTPDGWVEGQIKEWYGYIVQQVIGSNGVPFITHYPPANTALTQGVQSQYCARGRRGLAVRDRLQPIRSQPVRLAWCGIDIDGADNRGTYLYSTADNPEERVETLSERVVRLLGSKMMVRLSKSGEGVHCFLRVATAPEMTYDKARAVAKMAVAPYVKLLKDNQIHCCVTGLPNLWVWTSNGKQRTLCVPAHDEDVTPYLGAVPFTWAQPGLLAEGEGEGEGYVELAEFGDAKIRDVVTALCSAGILTTPPATRTQVNVARVKKTLKGHCDFKTKAKGREGHEHEPNGVLMLSYGELKLLSNADNNKVVLKLVEL